jgi:hypothetical protein
MELTAVLIDTVSNQEYIFSGNRLKENLGGSHLLKTAYQEPLQAALDKAAPGNDGISAWRCLGDTVALVGGCEVGYIGGGNALIFFDSLEQSGLFIREFSRILLKSRPGLKTAFGVLHPFDCEAFPASMKDLHSKLQAAKNHSFPQTIPPQHGITAACPYSGQAVELGREDKGRRKAVSALSFSRLSAAESSTEALTSKVKDRLQNLGFTDDLGKLGQTDSRSYVAVVHADGNGMGQRFMDCGALGALRKLSAAVSEATDQAFSLLVEEAVKVVEVHLADEEGFRFERNLPLRPVIIGGDDITFVCEGRLGL